MVQVFLFFIVDLVWGFHLTQVQGYIIKLLKHLNFSKLIKLLKFVQLLILIQPIIQYKVIFLQ